MTTVTRRNGLETLTTETIILPLPPGPELRGGHDGRFEMEIYARFMRHLRSVPNSRMEIKILAAIQFTADMLDTSEALIAKTLVDLGLLAPRRAFPGSFLDFCDNMLLRAAATKFSDDHSTPPQAVSVLKGHWDLIGENRFGPLPVHYAIFNDGQYVSH
ncbi:MAG: hypothetical protein JWO78_2254 [Micavibrio sp.]|nr:hypothetical protein [Micavibrio sp.]